MALHFYLECMIEEVAKVLANAFTVIFSEQVISVFAGKICLQLLEKLHGLSRDRSYTSGTGLLRLPFERALPDTILCKGIELHFH